MKLISLLDHLAATPASPTATPRRALLQHLGQAAVAALPLSLGALPAAASTQDTALDAITQLLLLERLQATLYARALAATGLIPATLAADFQRLRTHQDQHVLLLQTALQSAGAVVPATPTFDFSGQHGVSTNPVLFPNVFSSFDDFLALAQQLEDLGVRLYKAHAFTITSDAQLLRAVLRIHAVEAQHSAHVRALRRSRGAVVQTWPTEEDAPIVRPAAAQVLTAAATGGEENSIQYVSAGVPVPFSTLLLINNNTAIHDPAQAEAFDEPVNTTTAQNALNLFV